jgi:hypothetical protein
MCQEHGFDHDHIIGKIQDAADTIIGHTGTTEVHDVLFRVEGYGQQGTKKAYMTTIETRKEAVKA